ncbi:mannose-6-phosphate isomerase [Flavobacterium covae]|uniref:Phosphohexomutase n=1 Tax=Flavobacterium covae TaxID=2906076 RepID=A0ABW8PF58_9FLAO|nr:MULTISPECIES: type I phosphomannose isomerase catalytic subunit [Flavobacterium]AND63205.1 mannose-6-phosphate isomerase [Flavobacterium covae]OWP82453.1 mannose-6-phosphate isomerase [Flavobacterium covae]POR22522.1 mannose-6-phosphate isomerase [Flavobacterium columnare]
MPIELYPLQFEPIFKDRIWGGTRLKTLLNKSIPSEKTGESWELAAIDQDVSQISQGIYKGVLLTELIEKYPVEILGSEVYQRFGTQFPLLFKFLDAREDLSIQVHPNDALAKERHNSFGKTEMWYVVEAEPEAKLIVGFKEDASKEAYLEHLKNKNLSSILEAYPVKEGDVFYLETGTVHAIGAGTVVAEIQQTSDITYRIYDFDRKDAQGNLRELHIELALDAIDYKKKKVKVDYKLSDNQAVNVVDSPYFTVKVINLKETYNYHNKGNSFVAYMCIKGNLQVKINQHIYEFAKGNTFLIPAALKDFQLIGKAKLLEIVIS